MAFVVTKDIETGNKVIDKEHVELFAKINDFMDACNKGKGQTEIAKTVDFLRKYTKAHFANEENLQKTLNYPNYATHKRFHEQFIANLDEIASDLQKNGVSATIVGRINIKIGTALIAHIKSEDVKLAKFLKEKQSA